jgi:hypothetical protein
VCLKQRLANVIFHHPGGMATFKVPRAAPLKATETPTGKPKKFRGSGWMIPVSSMDGEKADGNGEGDVGDEAGAGVIGSARGCCCSHWGVES